MPGSKHIDGVDAPHIVKVDFVRILATSAAKTGIVDKDIDFAIFCHSSVNQRLQVRFVEHIALYGKGVAVHFCNLVGYSLRLLYVYVADHDRCTLIGKYKGTSAAHAVAAAGNHGHHTMQNQRQPGVGVRLCSCRIFYLVVT